MRAALALALAACRTAPCGLAAPAAVDRPNVLLVVLDDVGVDQLARWGIGATTAPTPTLDCLCDRGVRFDTVWASSVCSPGRAQLLTGRLSVRNRIGHNIERGEALPDEEVTIGELAQSAGYATAWVGKWHLGGFDSPDGALGPNRQGFDHFAGSLANLSVGRDDVPHHELGYHDWIEVVDGEAREVHTYATTATVDRALAFVRGTSGPWLLGVSFNAPHLPRHVPPARLLDGPVLDRPDAQYRAMLAAADHELGRLLQEMDPDVLGDTMIVVTSDNGTPAYAVAPPVDPAQHKGTLLEGGLRVPLLVAGPGVPADRVSAALVHHVDVLPTIAAWIGARPEAALDGVSLADAVRDPSRPVHDVLVDVMFGPDGDLRAAARDDRYKLVRGLDGTTLTRLSPAGYDDGPPVDEPQEAARLGAALDRAATPSR
ncbi:MAG: sulfatase-like hydrolase/transferase [Myxococcota bacterium]